MFNIGFSELLILGLIALIFIGPNQLPEVARTIGRLLNEWKRATSDFQSSITTHLTEEVKTRRTETPEYKAAADAEYAKHIGTPPATPGTHESGAGTVTPEPALPVGVHPVSEDDTEKKS